MVSLAIALADCTRIDSIRADRSEHNSGQLMAVNNNSTINSTAESAAYTYDLQGRLVTSSQTTNSTSPQRRFSYDRWGNRTAVWDATSGGTQIQSTTLQQSGGVPTNRLSSVTTIGVQANYTYDAAGNVTNDGSHSYLYDGENRLASVDSGAASYGYDAQNRRIKKSVAGTTTHYVWEGTQVIAEYNAATGVVMIEYTYAGSRMLTAGTSYVLSDRLSARLMLDTSFNVVGRQGHLPFGEEIAASGTADKHKFTSYERDSESGTDYAVNRQYGQNMGRFMRVDPVEGSIKNPQSLNRYTYVRNDPINQVDPSGLIAMALLFCHGGNSNADVENSNVLEMCDILVIDFRPLRGEGWVNPKNEECLNAANKAIQELGRIREQTASLFVEMMRIAAAVDLDAATEIRERFNATLRDYDRSVRRGMLTDETQSLFRLEFEGYGHQIADLIKGSSEEFGALVGAQIGSSVAEKAGTSLQKLDMACEGAELPALAKRELDDLKNELRRIHTYYGGIFQGIKDGLSN